MKIGIFGGVLLVIMGLVVALSLGQERGTAVHASKELFVFGALVGPLGETQQGEVQRGNKIEIYTKDGKGNDFKVNGVRVQITGCAGGAFQDAVVKGQPSPSAKWSSGYENFNSR